MAIRKEKKKKSKLRENIEAIVFALVILAIFAGIVSAALFGVRLPVVGVVSDMLGFGG